MVDISVRKLKTKHQQIRGTEQIYVTCMDIFSLFTFRGEGWFSIEEVFLAGKKNQERTKVDMLVRAARTKQKETEYK